MVLISPRRRTQSAGAGAHVSAIGAQSRIVFNRAARLRQRIVEHHGLDADLLVTALMHEPATVAEVTINGDVWKKLPDDQKEVIKSAAMDATLRSQLVMNKLNAEAIVELREKHGVTIARTPPDILTKMLEGYDLYGTRTNARVRLASIYLEQADEEDIGIGLAHKHGVPMVESRLVRPTPAQAARPMN